jgi:methanogenic corrinoid protein MtbC1
MDSLININDIENALLRMDRIKLTSIIGQTNQFNDFCYLITKALENIGNGWQDGNVSLAQVYMSGVICEELMEQYLPQNSLHNKLKPKIGIAVLEDRHALGKRIVSSIILANGYSLIDFGCGLTTDEAFEKSLENQIDILLISVLMYSSAIKVKELKEKFIRNNSKIFIVVGGAPFRLSDNLWRDVKADAFGYNASDVIDIIKRLVV